MRRALAGPPLVTATLAVLACTAAAQEAAEAPSARDVYRDGLRLAQAGDTARALEALDRAVRLDPTYAPAHFQRGMLRLGAGEAAMRDRLDAHKAFQEAIRLDPGNPRYLLELGKLLLSQEIRVDAARVFERALEQAERIDRGTLAEIHYQLAVFEETQWLRLRDRHRLPADVGELRADLAFADPRFVWRMLDRSSWHSGQGEAERDAMLEHLRRALSADPAHAGAATLLLGFLYDEGRLEEFMGEARRFARAAPTEPAAYLALGMGLHALGREDEAAGAFEYAAQLMPEARRAEFLAVSRLMRSEEAERFASLEGATRDEARRRFWAAADPLWLTPSNEFQVEYLSRMAYADLRFGLPEYGVPGWRTDRGEIWVRYGPPERQAVFPPSTGFTGDFESTGRLTTVWSYGPEGPSFVFRQNPGYRRATFANDFRFYADEMREMKPHRFTSPSIPALLEVPLQVARFRGRGGGVEVEVHAALPVDSLTRAAGVPRLELETGFFVVDRDGVEIRRLTDPEPVEVGETGPRLVRSWRTPVPEGEPYLVSVEARDPLSWAAAARRVTVEETSFPAGSVSMSDLLLGTVVEPLTPEPRSRADFRVVAEPTLRFVPDRPLGLYVELYNLLPDDDGFVSYELEVVVTVEEIHREGPIASLLGELADAWGFSPEGDQAVHLRFGKEARVESRDVLPEWFTVDLADPPPGRYAIELRLRDRNAGAERSTSRTFEVVESGGR